MKTVIFPEGNNSFIKEAAEKLKDFCQSILLDNNLIQGAEMLAQGKADAMVAGIDYSSRDVILAVRDIIGVTTGQKTFSSLFVADFPDGRRFILSDGATCKNPSVDQLVDIILLTHTAATKLLVTEPKVAMLSFSTFGSGGSDPSIAKMTEAIKLVKAKTPNIKIDGEMQLDAAIDPRIGQKKSPNSAVAGQANVLIVPDLNSGNILYKSIEHFSGAVVAGPVLLGFNAPVSDLSRGSTIDDIISSTKTVLALT